MIVYVCNQCDANIPERLRITPTAYGHEQGHFCSVQCFQRWLAWSGYGKVDQPRCGKAGPRGPKRAFCDAPAGHDGKHWSVLGHEWPQDDVVDAEIACSAEHPVVPGQSCGLPEGHNGLHETSILRWPNG